MKMKSIKYSCGDIFCIPLENYYMIGIIARVGKHGFLGYYLQKKYKYKPILKDILKNIFKDQVLLIMITSSLGIKNGQWPLLGNIEEFDPKNWPVPIFKRLDSISDKYSLVHYDEKLEEISIESAGKRKINDYWDDGLAGYGFIEKRIKRLYEGLES